MKDPKLIGLIMAWGQEKWIRLGIEQALKCCDEVIAMSAPYIPELRELEDNTYNIFKEYPDVKLVDIQETWGSYKEGYVNILNYMLQNSKLFLPGNWLWKLFGDEFYPESTYEEIKSIIKEGKYDKITMEEKYFFINMQYYLKGSHSRLVQVRSGEDKFPIRSHFSREDRKIYTISRKTGMFHYSLLQNIKATRLFWSVEYGGKKQRGRKNRAIRWLDEIYAKYDLENEDYWNKKSFELNGCETPCWSRDFTTDKNGRLFRYNGKHPRIIEKAGLPKIKDFRKWYD